MEISLDAFAEKVKDVGEVKRRAGKGKLPMLAFPPVNSRVGRRTDFETETDPHSSFEGQAFSWCCDARGCRSSPSPMHHRPSRRCSQPLVTFYICDGADCKGSWCRYSTRRSMSKTRGHSLSHTYFGFQPCLHFSHFLRSSSCLSAKE